MGPLPTQALGSPPAATRGSTCLSEQEAGLLQGLHPRTRKTPWVLLTWEPGLGPPCSPTAWGGRWGRWGAWPHSWLFSLHRAQASSLQRSTVASHSSFLIDPRTAPLCLLALRILTCHGGSTCPAPVILTAIQGHFSGGCVLPPPPSQLGSPHCGSDWRLRTSSPGLLGKTLIPVCFTAAAGTHPDFLPRVLVALVTVLRLR